jgi:KH/beta-lactamase-domain protein
VSARDAYREIVKKRVADLLPNELEITKIEYEGPEVSVYAKNLLPIYENPDIVRNVARQVRKRIVVKPDEEIRKPRGEAKDKILEIAGKDNVVDVDFEPSTGEVYIVTTKPGYVVGKGGQRQRRILVETGWKPVVIRQPPIDSTTIKEIRSFYRRAAKTRLDVLKDVGERIHRPLIFKSEQNHVRITALGGFQEVGRSAILLETRESKVLLDFGVNLSSYDPAKHFPRAEDLPIEELDAVVVTHAHLDHCGLVPLLYKYGYRGPVYVTPPTRDLMYLMLKDYIDVAQKQGRLTPFSHADINDMMLRTIAINYGEVTDIAPDIKLTFHNAGHILGSAMAHLHVGEGFYNVVYTGDMKYTNTKLLNRASDKFPRVEAVIMESTYGTEDLPPRELSERILIDIINKTLERGGFVLIPVLAIGRGQEILLVLVDAIKKGLLKTSNGKAPKIYLDGMVWEVTAIHAAYPEWLSKEIKEKILQGENPFLEDFVERVSLSEVSRKDLIEREPGVIIATSGMLTGGPALEYFKYMAVSSFQIFLG